MDVLHLRADGHAVQSRQLLAEEAALQSGVDGLHLRLLAEHLPVGIHHNLPEVGFLPVLPGGIVAGFLALGTVEFRQLLEPVQQLPLLLVDAAAHGKVQMQPLLQLQHAQVQAGLGQALYVLAPGLDTVGGAVQQGNHPGGILRTQAVAPQGIHIVPVDGSVGLVVLPANLLLELLGNVIDFLRVHPQGYQGALTAVGNYIVLVAAGELGQADGHSLLNPLQKQAHNLIGVGTVFVNLHTGVTALQALHHQADTGTVNGPALHRQSQVGSGTAGAGYGEHPFIVGVQVDEGTAPKPGKVNIRSAEHSRFLVHGDNHFQRGVRNGLVRQQSHGKSHRNAVVSSQGGALGEHPLSVMGHIQSFGLHINGAVCILLAYHIHMPLEHHRGMILIPGRPLLEQQHIVERILNIGNPLFLGKGYQIVADGLGIAGAVGNGTQGLKIAHNRLGLQPG